MPHSIYLLTICDNANQKEHEDDNKTNNVKLTSTFKIVCSRMTLDMMVMLQLKQIINLNLASNIINLMLWFENVGRNY